MSEPVQDDLTALLSLGGNNYTAAKISGNTFYLSQGRTDRGISEQPILVQNNNLIYFLSFQVHKPDNSGYVTPVNLTDPEEALRDLILSTFKFTK